MKAVIYHKVYESMPFWLQTEAMFDKFDVQSVLCATECLKGVKIKWSLELHDVTWTTSML